MRKTVATLTAVLALAGCGAGASGSAESSPSPSSYGPRGQHVILASELTRWMREMPDA